MIELAPGNWRQVLIRMAELMQVETGFDKGAISALRGRLLDMFTPMRPDFV